MTTQIRPTQLLLERLLNDIPTISGWAVTETGSGGYTVNTPTGRVQIPAPAKLTDDLAEKALTRLSDKGMDLKLATKDSARNGRKRTTAAVKADAKNRMRPPAYPGEPSPDEGDVRRKVLLTPELARELLDRPFEAITSDGRELHQRVRVRDNVDKFVKLIRRKHFRLTHQGLAIGENGSLYDGQHRCLAVIDTNTPVEVWVNYNVHPDTIEAMDGGRQRRASTKLAMEGFEHALELGSAARLLFFYLDYETAMSMGEGGGQLIAEWRKWCHIRIDDIETLDIVHAHSQLYGDLLWAIENKSMRKDKLKPASVAVFRYLARRAWPEADPIEKAGNETTLLDTFLLAVVRHIGIDNEAHIAITLQRWAERANDQPTRYAREAQLAALLKAWALYNQPPKRPVRSFPPHLDNQFPLAYKPKKKAK